MTTTSAPTTTSDERVMAALAHFFGLIAAVIIWALHKDKSRFIRFQALQALAFDALVMIVNLVLMMCLMGLIMVGMAAAVGFAVNNPGSEQLALPIVAGITFPMLMFACILPFSLVFMLVRIFATVSVATGRDFRYPLIAKQVEAFLAHE